ncbi:TMEM175 family protein [Humibacillus xanthopallidus]|uniref:TMEM175 family protein n=1 Tax=Humibacillus xanthopallidus TaxID=412689 RepID=UPI0021AB469F|nr:TMEM175 family protein [Humibacillus xanthopallidus]
MCSRNCAPPGWPAISFLITRMYWVAHRDLFMQVQWVNRDVVWLNLLFLFTMGPIPFGASVLGHYPSDPIALQLYGVIMVVASIMRLVQLTTGSSDKPLPEPVTNQPRTAFPSAS